jgi:porphobilinogen synthase
MVFSASNNVGGFPNTRLRRLRQPQIRSLVRETELSVNDLVLPLFIRHGQHIKNPIKTMPGHYQLSIDYLPETIDNIISLDIPAVILFGIPAHKDAVGTDAWRDDGIIQQAIATIKDMAPSLLVISDCCFCEYTEHGHCGVINDKTGWPDVDNDATLELLAKQAISHAAAGSDVIAPSGMIDGMVTTIRQALDNESYETIPILSYAVKYASALYAPFREAAEGAPQFGDRRTYQMDPANGQEALREAALDINEGADMLLIKPAQYYLDIIYRIKQQFPAVPLGGYQVSGEFAMIKAASANGWLDEKAAVLESLYAIKRSGASFIISYFAQDVARWLKEAR